MHTICEYIRSILKTHAKCDQTISDNIKHLFSTTFFAVLFFAKCETCWKCIYLLTKISVFVKGIHQIKNIFGFIIISLFKILNKFVLYRTFPVAPKQSPGCAMAAWLGAAGEMRAITRVRYGRMARSSRRDEGDPHAPRRGAPYRCHTQGCCLCCHNPSLVVACARPCCCPRSVVACAVITHSALLLVLS